MLIYWLFILSYSYLERYNLLLILNELYYNYKHSNDNNFKIKKIISEKIENYYVLEYEYNNGKKYLFISNIEILEPPYSSTYILKYRNSKQIVKSDDDIILGDIILKNDKIIDGLDIIKMLSGPLGNFYNDINHNGFTLERFKKVSKIENGFEMIKRIEIIDSNGQINEFL